MQEITDFVIRYTYIVYYGEKGVMGMTGMIGIIKRSQTLSNTQHTSQTDPLTEQHIKCKDITPTQHWYKRQHSTLTAPHTDK